MESICAGPGIAEHLSPGPLNVLNTAGADIAAIIREMPMRKQRIFQKAKIFYFEKLENRPPGVFPLDGLRDDLAKMGVRGHSQSHE